MKIAFQSAPNCRKLLLLGATCGFVTFIIGSQAATLVEPISVAQNPVDEDVSNGRVAANLITDSGLSATPTASNFLTVTEGGGHWRTGSSYGPNYFAGGGTPPQFVFGLDGTYSLTDFVYWGFLGNGAEATAFTIEFSADNGVTYPNSVHVASEFLLGYNSTNLSFGASYTANFIRLTITGNAATSGFPNPGGGNQVAMGKVRFLGTKVATLVKPISVTQNPVDEDVSNGRVAANLITDSGLSATPTASNFLTVTEGGGHWRTGSSYGPNYFAGGGTPPQFVFGLDGTYSLTDFVYWGFLGNGAEATAFTIEFSADNGVTYTNSVDVASEFLLGYNSTNLSFGASYTANFIRLTITGNAATSGFPNPGGGNQVAMGKVRFLGAQVSGPPVPPGISVQPASQMVLAGDNVTLSVTAAGTAPLKYQWQWYGTNITDAGNVSGTQTNTLTLGNIQAGQAGSYSVIITNVAGSVTSAVAQVTVVTPPPPNVVLVKPISVTQDPVDEDVSNGRVAANLITDSGLSQTPVTSTNYPFITEGGGHWRTGTSYGPNYFDGGGTPPQFVFGLGGTYLLTDFVYWGFLGNGAEATAFTVEFSADNGATYTNSVDVASEFLLGYNSTNLSFGASYTANTVRLTITGNAATSGFPNSGGGNQVAMGKVRFLGTQVSGPPVPPGITVQPAGQLVLAGANFSLSVTAGGTGPLKYQWQWYGTNITDGGNISGTHTNTLTLGNIQAGNAGPYSVIITNVAGSVTSAVAQVNVFTPPPPSVVLVTPISVVQDPVDEDVSNGRVAANLITDSGLSQTPVTSANYPFITEGGGHWRTGSSYGPNYFAGGGTPPQFVFGLGGTYLLTDFVYWGFLGNGAEATAFTVEFSADNGATYTNSVDVASEFLLGYSSTNLSFGASYTANTVRLTITGNAATSGFPNPGGGNQVAMGKVRFLGQPLVLSISRAAHGLTISWPAGFTGFTLESAGQLPATSWSPVPGVVNNQVTIPIGTTNAFYRLRQ